MLELCLLGIGPATAFLWPSRSSLLTVRAVPLPLGLQEEEEHETGGRWCGDGPKLKQGIMKHGAAAAGGGGDCGGTAAAAAGGGSGGGSGVAAVAARTRGGHQGRRTCEVRFTQAKWNHSYGQSSSSQPTISP